MDDIKIVAYGSGPNCLISESCGFTGAASVVLLLDDVLSAIHIYIVCRMVVADIAYVCAERITGVEGNRRGKHGFAPRLRVEHWSNDTTKRCLTHTSE
jgi:hypothetical protein